MGKIKVAIDAGHGSQTAGKRTPDGYREHWINVKAALACEKFLQANGVETVRIGWDDDNSKDDIDVALSIRQKKIKDEGCDYSVSCHANAYGDGKSYNSAAGVSTHIHSNSSCRNDSLRFAQCIQTYIVQGTEQKDRGVIKQALAMCNCKAMGTKASCLVEIAFMTNKAEANLMKTETFCKEQGEDIARGILEYLGISVIQEEVAPNNDAIVIAPMAINKGNPQHFSQIVRNIKMALNADYGLTFAITDTVDDVLLINLGNVVLGISSYKKNITFALTQLLVWWGYSLPVSSTFTNTVKNIVSTFQKQTGLPQTGTTTKEVWKKLLGK